jgi:16S rRNA (adenine1518-N6/adenine1519-N6)-dimethyltransferase
LGQNFLVDPAARARLLAALAPQPRDRFVEIGPGKGEITAELARSAAAVVAVELDPHLAEQTRDRCRDLPNVTVIHGDALELNLAQFSEGIPASLRLFGNLPYATATAILRHLLDQWRWILDLTVLLQREVAERVAAQPGTREYGFLSLIVQLRATVEPLVDLGPRSFRPRPQVASRLIRLRPFAQPPDWPPALEPLLEAAFGYRRKQLLGALTLHSAFANREDLKRAFERAGIPPTVRGETLTSAEFIRLAKALGAS